MSYILPPPFRDVLYVELNKMVHKEIPLPHSVNRKWFSVCLSVDKEFLDITLDGVSVLGDKDRDISSVQGGAVS